MRKIVHPVSHNSGIPNSNFQASDILQHRLFNRESSRSGPSLTFSNDGGGAVLMVENC